MDSIHGVTGGRHPYLHAPLLYISHLPAYVTDENLAMAFVNLGPFRPRIQRENDGYVNGYGGEGDGGAERMLTGTIEFKFQDKAEKALAILQGTPIPDLGTHVPLILSPYPLHQQPAPQQYAPQGHGGMPPPNALPRLVKQLPEGFTDSQLYDLFRPFGPLANVRINGASLSLSASGGVGGDSGVVSFWNEDDAIRAEEAMHCAEVEGRNIAVQIYQPPRQQQQHPHQHPQHQHVFGMGAGVGGFNVAAMPFVPSAVTGFYHPPQHPPGTFSPYSNSPPRQAPYSPSPVRSPVPVSGMNLPLSIPSSPSMGYLGHALHRDHGLQHGPGQQVQAAPPGMPSHSGLIDPCNLFVKNLSPEIDSNGLFAHFTKFGQIVSARVMRNEHGESRGFGFVSYHQPEHAAAALQAMNGMLLGSKQVVVRLHEPKQLRQEKLAHRFASTHTRRNSSGATSPAASEIGFGEGWGSPRGSFAGLSISGGGGGGGPGTPRGLPGHQQDRGRRGSGSYYAAALNGTLNIPLTYNSLSTLSPVVRREVLSGELNKRVRAMEEAKGMDDKGVEEIVEGITSLTLSSVVQILDDSNAGGGRLRERVAAYRAKHPEAVLVESPSGSDEQVAAPAAIPDHVLAHSNRSTPAPQTFTRTSSPRGSVPPLSERDRVFTAISKLEKGADEKRLGELVSLVMSLPKRERALCLFNSEVMKSKLEDAKVILDAEDVEEGEKTESASASEGDDDSTKSAPQIQVKPGKRGVLTSVSTPDLATPTITTAPTATSTPPLPPPPPTATKVTTTTSTSTSSTGATYTLTTLAALPSPEILTILRTNPSLHATLSLPVPSPSSIIAMETFMDSIKDKPVQGQKQALGEKLYKVVKGFGIKGVSAPKVTVALLDGEELRALAVLMGCYVGVLKEKVGKYAGGGK